MCTLDNAWLLPPANAVWGKVIFVHLSVILFTGGVCPIECWDTPPGAESSPEQTLPQADTPPGPEAGTLPPAQCMLRGAGNKRAVRILLECDLVFLLPLPNQLVSCQHLIKINSSVFMGHLAAIFSGPTFTRQGASVSCD